jgi:hypothetical protein
MLLSSPPALASTQNALHRATCRDASGAKLNVGTTQQAASATNFAQHRIFLAFIDVTNIEYLPDF